MTNAFSIVLYVLNQMLLLWMLLYKVFIPKNAASLLTILLLLTLFVDFFSKNIYAVYCIYLTYIVEYLLIRKYLSSWLIPSVVVIIQDALITIVQLVTFYVPVYFLSQSLFSKPYYISLIILIQTIIIYFISVLFKRIDSRYSVFYLLRNFQSSHPAQGIFLVLLFFLLLTSHTYLYMMRYRVTLIVLFILIFLLGYTLLSAIVLIHDNRQKKVFLHDLKLVLKEERTNFELAREYRHDINSALLGLTEFLSNEDIQGAKNYLKELTSHSSSYLKEYRHAQLITIHSTALRGLLNEFINRCQSNNIPVELNIDDEGVPLPIGQIDFLQATSILLNNAFEASLEEKNPYIQFSLENKANYLEVQIENTVTKAISIHESITKNFSTKEGHSGIGLTNLNKIMEKYTEADFQLQVIENQFIAVIEIRY